MTKKKAVNEKMASEAADWEEKLIYNFQRFLPYRAPAPERGIWRQITLRDPKNFPRS